MFDLLILHIGHSILHSVLIKKSMNNAIIVDKTVEFVKATLVGAEGGHDWWHIYRVWKTAKHIAQTESVDTLVVELGALLHDIADYKFHGGDEEIGPRKTREFLTSLNVDESIIVHVENIVRHISFRGGAHVQEFTSPEMHVVQDADSLDAVGAIGIARTFNYGGHIQRKIYNPEVLPNLHMTAEEYKQSITTTINHFYEKLLLLKDRMNTETGKRMAQHRHEFMEAYLDEFYKEWEGTV